MAKQNCWEHKKCGREPGGAKAGELGVCPASTESRMNGVHSGVNGGRACWVLGGTLCGGQVQGSYAQKLGNCLNCEFYKEVVSDEGKQRIGTSELLQRLN